MKRKLFIPALIIGLYGCNNEIDSERVLSVSADKMNVLYIGIENSLTIAVSGIASSDLEVTIDNGEIKGENGMYLVLPAEKGEAIISISKGKTYLGEATFRVKTMPDPVASLGGLTHGTIKLKELLNLEGIDVLQSTDFDLRMTVKSFRITKTDGEWDEMQESNSDKFTSEQLELMESLKVGETFYIHEIIVIGPDGIERKLPAIILTIDE